MHVNFDHSDNAMHIPHTTYHLADKKVQQPLFNEDEL